MPTEETKLVFGNDRHWRKLRFVACESVRKLRRQLAGANLCAMGAWGLEPWANDAAADWLQMFDVTGLSQQIEDALELPAQDHADEIRVAVYVLLQLSESYVWPVESRRWCLETADARLSEILTSGKFTNTRLLAAIAKERDAIRLLLQNAAAQ